MSNNNNNRVRIVNTLFFGTNGNQNQRRFVFCLINFLDSIHDLTGFNLLLMNNSDGSQKSQTRDNLNIYH